MLGDALRCLGKCARWFPQVVPGAASALGNPRRSRPELGTGADPRRGARACLATVSRSPTGPLTSPSLSDIHPIRQADAGSAGDQAGSLPPRIRERTPWRPMGADVVSFGIPVGIGVLHPVLGEVIAVIAVAIMLTVICTPCSAAPDLSERAFRLLRWIGNRPEPPRPGPTRASRRQ
jgi:hypothetical protein